MAIVLLCYTFLSYFCSSEAKYGDQRAGYTTPGYLTGASSAPILSAMADRDELLDIKQAADFLNVSETSLRRWTNAGRLACLRVGRKRERRFRRADLMAFMEEQPAEGLGGNGGSDASRSRHTAADRTAGGVGNHLCGLYRSDEGRAKLATSFLADGLHQGSVCFLTALPKVREEILAHLEAEHPTLGQDVDAGRLVLSKYHMSAGAQYDYCQSHFVEALRGGARSLCAVGDMGGFFHTIGAGALVDYEAGYERFIARRYPVATLCAYDARVFSAIDVVNALEVHADTLRYAAERVIA
jgi:excisionase family DNA binding protein